MRRRRRRMRRRITRRMVTRIGNWKSAFLVKDMVSECDNIVVKVVIFAVVVERCKGDGNVSKITEVNAFDDVTRADRNDMLARL